MPVRIVRNPRFGGSSFSRSFSSSRRSFGSSGGSLRSRLASTFGPKRSRVVSVRSRTSPAQASNQRFLKQLADRQRQLQERLNREAEARFNRVNQLARDTAVRSNQQFGQAQQLVQGVGEDARRRIEDSRVRGLASAQQGLVSAGLGNTTITASAARGVNSDAQRANLANDEQVARLRSGLLTQQAQFQPTLGGLQIDTELSRQNTFPNQNLFQQLLAQIASRGF